MKRIEHRAMGYWETLNALVHDELSGHGNLACQVELSKPIEFIKFKDACNIVFNEQPLLRATYQRNTSNYDMYINACFSDIDIIYEQVNDKARAQDVYSEFLKTPFNIKKSLWRVALLSSKKQAWLIIGLSHAIGDGLSLAAIANRLLDIYFSSAYEIKPVALTPPIEKLIDTSYFNHTSSDFFEQNSFDQNDEGGNNYKLKINVCSRLMRLV